MAARAWPSQIPPRSPVEPGCRASTRNPLALFASSLVGSPTPWASALWGRSSGLVSPRKQAKSRASSNTPWQKITEASETTSLTSTTSVGPRDTPRWIRGPQGHLILWRPLCAFRVLPAARPHARVPCPWDGSRAPAPGVAHDVWTTRTATPSPRPAAESLLGYPLPKASRASLRAQRLPLTSAACRHTEDLAGQARRRTRGDEDGEALAPGELSWEEDGGGGPA